MSSVPSSGIRRLLGRGLGAPRGSTRRTGVYAGALERLAKSSSRAHAAYAVLELHALGEAVVGDDVGTGDQASRPGSR